MLGGTLRGVFLLHMLRGALRVVCLLLVLGGTLRAMEGRLIKMIEFSFLENLRLSLLLKFLWVRDLRLPFPRSFWDVHRERDLRLPLPLQTLWRRSQHHKKDLRLPFPKLSLLRGLHANTGVLLEMIRRGLCANLRRGQRIYHRVGDLRLPSSVILLRKNLRLHPLMIQVKAANTNEETKDNRGNKRRGERRNVAKHCTP